MFPLLPESRDGILLMRSDLLPQVFSEHLLSSSPQVDGSRDLRGPGACTESGNANYTDVECRSYSDGFGLETSPGLMPLAPHKSFTPVSLNFLFWKMSAYAFIQKGLLSL